MSFQAYDSATDTLTPIAENDYKDSLEKISALPTASADLLNKCYLLISNQGAYSKGNIFQCQSDGSSGYTWILINGSGVPVDVVEDGNMNGVTSNAVADKFATLGTASEKDFTNFVSPTDSGVPISSSVFSAITSALYGAYHPSGSKTIAELDSSLLVQANVGNVYKITDSGVTTNLFIGGAGQTINVGDNAVVVYDTSGEAFKYALQSGVVDLSEYQTKELPSGAMIEDIIPSDASASNKLVTEGTLDELHNVTYQMISDTELTTTATDYTTFSDRKLSDYDYFIIQQYDHSSLRNAAVINLNQFKLKRVILSTLHGANSSSVSEYSVSGINVSYVDDTTINAYATGSAMINIVKIMGVKIAR